MTRKERTVKITIRSGLGLGLALLSGLLHAQDPARRNTPGVRPNTYGTSQIGRAHV